MTGPTSWYFPNAAELSTLQSVVLREISSGWIVYDIPLVVNFSVVVKLLLLELYQHELKLTILFPVLLTSFHFLSLLDDHGPGELC